MSILRNLQRVERILVKVSQAQRIKAIASRRDKHRLKLYRNIVKLMTSPLVLTQKLRKKRKRIKKYNLTSKRANILWNRQVLKNQCQQRDCFTKV